MRSPEMALRSTRNTVELNALALGTGIYREVPASCAQVPREAREAPRRPPAPVELPLPMASLESAAVVGRQFVAGVSPAVCVCVCRTGAGLLGFVRVSPCVGVNVNMTHATTGATTLLRHCYVVHTPYVIHVRRMTDDHDALRTHIRDVGSTRRSGFSHREERSRVVSAGGPRRN